MKNLSDRPITLPHDVHGDVTIKPHAERVVPFEYIIVAFGDPRIHNDGDNRVRTREYQDRLTLWGYYPGITSAEEWAEIAPQFEVYDMDGERIWTILEDPDGTRANPAFDGEVDLDDATAMRMAMADMQRKMERMQQIIEASTAKETEAAVAEGSSDPVPAPKDLPEPGDAANSTETQESRNEQRADLPTPKKAKVSKDKPRTVRTGS